MKKTFQRKATKTSNSSLNVPFDVLIGRAAMVGFVFAFGAYLTADIISPGIT